MSFDNAAAECKKKGMQLAVPESSVENKCVVLKVAEKGNAPAIEAFYK